MCSGRRQVEISREESYISQQAEDLKLHTVTCEELLQSFPKDIEARWLLNIAYMTLGEYPDKVPEPCQLTVIDVSFISLTLVLGKAAELMRGPGGKPILALVKPQFEVGKGQVGKGGVVRDEALRLGAVDKIRQFARERGFWVGEHVTSPITGPAGNVEFVLHLRTPEPG